MIAAAFPGAAGERHDRAEGGEVAGRVIGRGRRAQTRTVAAVLDGDAGYRLPQLLPAWALLPRSGLAGAVA